MSSLSEIEAAVDKLPHPEQQILDIELYRDRLPAFLLTSRERLVKAA